MLVVTMNSSGLKLQTLPPRRGHKLASWLSFNPQLLLSRGAHGLSVCVRRSAASLRMFNPSAPPSFPGAPPIFAAALSCLPCPPTPLVRLRLFTP